ncbi:SusC/RagA family TonB-linked outer membrane protein, partial [Streptococcus danieliae]|nr:SusC/RagA family TonB-linked outer membrane protein [Streptococcus danieliae]
MSTVLGIAAPKQNTGVVDNYGVELAAKWNDRIGDFTYQAGAMFSYSKNEIVEMNEQYRPYEYLRRTGKSLGQIFGYEVEGIYQNQKEIDDREVKQYLSE